MRVRPVRDGTGPVRDRLTRLNNLIGKKFNELESTLALNEKSGREAAFQLIDTGIGKRTMEEIRSEAGAMANDLRASLSTGTTRWRQDIEFARLGMVTMTAFTVALLLVVWVLARREIALREEQQERSILEQARLESIVSARTSELSELSNYLQSVREEEKSRVAREIHDELGGILVGAKMDVAWAVDRLKPKDATVAAKLEFADFHWLYVADLFRFRQGDMMTEGLSVYTPDERGRFVHKAEYDGHGWKMRDLKGLMLTHPGYDLGDFTLVPDPADTTGKRWTLKLAFKKSPPPVRR